MSTRTLLSAAAAGAATATVGLLVYFSLLRSNALPKATIDEISRLKAELEAAKKELRNSHDIKDISNPSSPTSTSVSSDILKPPLPFHVVRLLEASQLCFLSTSHNNDPHLSLMNFTYYQKDEVVILCTKRDTKKFRQIIKSNTVALLIHDFPNLKLDDQGTSAPPSPPQDDGSTSKGQTYSITLNGVCEVTTGDYAELLRNVHLKANPEYEGFIKQAPDSTPGCPSPAVLVVRIESARLCNFKDKVEHWDAKSAAAARAVEDHK